MSGVANVPAESESSREFAAEYMSSLVDLVNSSKPIITMLTMLADEGLPHAAAITRTIAEHSQAVREIYLTFYSALFNSFSESWSI